MGKSTVVATEVAKLQMFDRTLSKVSGFVGTCRMYIKMKLKGAPVEEQVNWVLSYIQGGLADIWQENIMEELEMEELEFESVEEFLAEIKKEFGEGDKESVKVAELKKIEQRSKTMEEFVQEFKRIARESSYEGHPLIEEFKWGMNGNIRRNLMEAENQPATVEYWFKRATTLDQNRRESRREEERLRGRKETGGIALKQEQQQILPRPLVWQRRQMPPQQATTGPAPMEGVKRTNAVVVRGQGQNRVQRFLLDGTPIQWR